MPSGQIDHTGIAPAYVWRPLQRTDPFNGPSALAAPLDTTALEIRIWSPEQFDPLANDLRISVISQKTAKKGTYVETNKLVHKPFPCQ